MVDMRKIITVLATHGVDGVRGWNLVVKLAQDDRMPTRAEWVSMGLRTSEEINALLGE